MGILEILLIFIVLCWLFGLGIGFGGAAINLLIIVIIFLAVASFVQHRNI